MGLKGFQPGNQLAKGIGRPPLELELEQLNLMREIVSKDLSLLKKVYEGKANEKDLKVLAAVQGRVTKYLDKLHATKNTLEGANGEPFILQVINYGTKDNTSTIQLPPERVPTNFSVCSPKVQGGSMEQKEWEIKDTNK